MAKVLIEKFVEGVRETSFRVPIFVLRLANGLLPESALSTLTEHGLEVRPILAAHAIGIGYSGTFMVREWGVHKRVFVSLQ